MGTITQRVNKSGQVKYTVQIRLRRKGVIVYQESQSFDRKAVARAWMIRREAELGMPGALDRATRDQVTIKAIIHRYLEEYELVRPLGKTKRAALLAVARSWIGEVIETDLTSQKLVEYARWRMSEAGGGVQAQTVSNDLAHLGAVLSVAQPAWGYQIDATAMPSARKVLRKMGMTLRSRERNRRPSKDELEKLFSHFSQVRMRRPSSLPMVKIIAFALFSTRRQEEITRIRWDDLDVRQQAVLVRDMKNPGQKIGNDVWCHLPDEAWRIAQSMPKSSSEIFPYNAGSISIAFARACKFLAIEDLKFHDLRHDGVSRLFEMDWDIPRVASVSGHRDWNAMRRYTHLKGNGDPYKGWSWIQKIIDAP